VTKGFASKNFWYSRKILGEKKKKKLKKKKKKKQKINFNPNKWKKKKFYFFEIAPKGFLEPVSCKSIICKRTRTSSKKGSIKCKEKNRVNVG